MRNRNKPRIFKANEHYEQIVSKKAKEQILRDNVSKLMHRESNLKYRYYSNPIKISNNEFVIAIISNKQLIKYNANCKQWKELFNYDDNLEEKLQDWTKKTNFENLKYVGYLCDNDDVAAGEMIRQNKQKIFLHFNVDSTYFGTKYAWITIPNHKLCVPPSVSFDESYNLLYDGLNNVYYIRNGQKTEAVIIDINNKTIKTLMIAKWKYFIKSSVVIQGKIHMIAIQYDHTYYHVIFDYKTKKSRLQYTFNGILNIYGLSPKLINISSRNMLFLIGKEIWNYCLQNKVWRKLDILLPDKIVSNISTIFLTNNKRFVMIFGSDCNSYLDLKSRTFTILDIMWPFGRSPRYAMSMANINDIDIEMITYGFTRNIWRINHLVLLFPPHEILRLIVIFYKEEYIHLLGKAKTQNHFIINIKDIIPSY